MTDKKRALHTVTAGAAACALLLLAGRAGALPLNLTTGAPDIASVGINTTYTAATDAFTASGFATFLLPQGQPSPPNPGSPINSGSFSLNATIDDFGNLTAGTISIGGNVNGAGPSLVTGDLTAVGFRESPPDTPPFDTFEFLFNVTGGDLAPEYGSTGGIILTMGQAVFPGNFSNDFSDTGFGGVSDTFGSAPEPGTLALIGVGLAGLAMRRRRGGNSAHA